MRNGIKGDLLCLFSALGLELLCMVHSSRLSLFILLRALVQLFHLSTDWNKPFNFNFVLIGCPLQTKDFNSRWAVLFAFCFVLLTELGEIVSFICICCYFIISILVSCWAKSRKNVRKHWFMLYSTYLRSQMLENAVNPQADCVPVEVVGKFRKAAA